MGLENQVCSYLRQDPNLDGINHMKRKDRGSSHALLSPKKLQDILAKIKEEEKKSHLSNQNRRNLRADSQPQTSPTKLQNILVKIGEEEKTNIYSKNNSPDSKVVIKERSKPKPLDVDTGTFQEKTNVCEKPNERPRVWDHYEMDPNDHSKSKCLYCSDIFDYVYKGGEKPIKGLMLHLSKKHDLYEKNEMKRMAMKMKMKMNRDRQRKELCKKPKERTKVWNHYEVDPNDQSKSKCLYCCNIFDYVYEGEKFKGLLMHLSIKHDLFVDDTEEKKTNRESKRREKERKKLMGIQFICKECGKAYREKRTQELCESRHRQEFQLICSDCGKGFNQKDVLEKHLLTHTENKPFKCPSCGKRFRTKTNLSQHLTVHSGETPYECQKCHKRFRFYGQRILHECIIANFETKN